MKIQKIEVKNFKAIADNEINLDGCSAIITAGNNKGKTSMLSGLIDRFRSLKPDVIVKEGEEKGYNILHLTDGSQIQWKFTEKTESFHFITKEGIKVTQGVIKQLSEKYFGKKFDVDKFIQSSPKDQVKVLQNIVGIDLTEIDDNISEKFKARTEAKKELDRIISLRKEAPEVVDKVDVESIQKSIEDARDENQKTFNDYTESREKEIAEIDKFNKEQDDKGDKISELSADIFEIKSRLAESEILPHIDLTGAELFIESLPKPSVKKEYPEPIDLDMIDVTLIEAQLQTANETNQQFAVYQVRLDEYNEWVSNGKIQRELYEKLDKEVKDLQAQKVKMISEAKIPEEFNIEDGEVKYKGFALSNSQISSSSKYIAALKLGSMVIGQLRSMHFDASFLDNNSLKEVQDWANNEGLQLLIERPDFDGGEIEYQIIQEA